MQSDQLYQNPDSIFDQSSLADFHSILRIWFNNNSRRFPWRTTSNPFFVLMAEMMLRRTRARQVIPVYENFILAYPDPASLASASPVQVGEHLYSLGLAWRVPAFQQLARTLLEKYNGLVPADYDALLSLPGCGPYVAAAVCCFAFHQPQIIVDTNTVRIIGRLYNKQVHAESRRNPAIIKLHKILLDYEYPRSYNLALLDLAALICTPQAPACHVCPLLSFCHTGQATVN